MHPHITGILLKLSHKIILTVYALMMVFINHKYPVTQLCLCLDISALVITTSLVLIFKIDLRLTKKSLYIYCWRSLFNCLGMITWIYALKHIGTNETTAICFTIPIFTTILAWLFCKEKFDLKCSLAILGGLIGSCIILQPKFQEGSIIGPITALFSAFMWASHDIICKNQTATEHHITQAFYSFLFSALLFMPFALYNWETITFNNFIQISMMSSLSVINILILFISYKLAPVYLLMPFSYSKLFFMAIGSYLVLGQKLNETTVIGSIMIILSTSFVFYQQYRNKAR